MQNCRTCEGDKDDNDFYKRKNGSLYKLCKKCHVQGCTARQLLNPNFRTNQLRWRYGITEADYEALVESQKSLCAICRLPCATKRRLAVDHNHTTGKIRGLLCMSCNTLLGKANDSIALLQQTISYLKKEQ